MPWTATVKSASKTSGDLGLAVSVEFSDGVKRYTIPFNVSDPATLERICRTQIEQYQKIADVGLNVGAVVVDTALDKPPVTPEPTADQMALQEFVTDYRQYRQLLKAVELGFEAEKSAVDLLSKLKSEWKIEYLQYLGA